MLRVRLDDVPAFTYRGGKGRLRRYIARWCPLAGSTYCEPFAGRANLFFLMRAVGGFGKWWLNDLQTIPFLRAILSYQGENLPALDKDTASSLMKRGGVLAKVMEPITLWAGGLLGKTSVTGHRGTDLSSYRRSLLAAKALLADVKLSCKDGVEVLGYLGTDPYAFAYVDPPYLGSQVGAYDEGMVDRGKLIEALKSARYRWLLSEYECADLVGAFGPPTARIKAVSVSPSPRNKSVRYVVECLWANFPTQPNRLDLSGFDRPNPLAHFIMERLGGRADFASWDRACPPHWARGTRRAQFSRICAHPDYYFDGEIVVSLR